MSLSMNNKVLKKGRDLKEEMSREMASKGYRKLVKKTLKIGLRSRETIRFLSNEFRQKALQKPLKSNEETNSKQKINKN